MAPDKFWQDKMQRTRKEPKNEKGTTNRGNRENKKQRYLGKPKQQ